MKFKVHAYGYKYKTVCGARIEQIPGQYLTGRISLVTCSKCARTLQRFGDSEIPPKYHPVLYRPSFYEAMGAAQ